MNLLTWTSKSSFPGPSSLRSLSVSSSESEPSASGPATGLSGSTALTTPFKRSASWPRGFGIFSGALFWRMPLKKTVKRGIDFWMMESWPWYLYISTFLQDLKHTVNCPFAWPTGIKFFQSNWIPYLLPLHRKILDVYAEQRGMSPQHAGNAKSKAGVLLQEIWLSMSQSLKHPYLWEWWLAVFSMSSENDQELRRFHRNHSFPPGSLPVADWRSR